MTNTRVYFNVGMLITALFLVGGRAAAQCESDNTLTALRFIDAMDHPGQAASVRRLSSNERQAVASEEFIRQGLVSRDAALGISASLKGTPQGSLTKISSPVLLRMTSIVDGCEMLFETVYPVGHLFQTVVTRRTPAGVRVLHFTEGNQYPGPPKLEFKLRFSITIDCRGVRCGPVENPLAADPTAIIRAIRLKVGAAQPKPYSVPTAAGRSPWIPVALEANSANVVLSIPNIDQDSANHWLVDDSPTTRAAFTAAAGRNMVAAVNVRPSSHNHFFHQTGHRLQYVIRTIEVGPER